MAPYFRFQAGESFAADDRIIGTYKEMYDAFFEEQGADPGRPLLRGRLRGAGESAVAVVGSIYEALGLAGFDEIRPRLECYLGTVAGYRKNRHDELPEPLRHRIVREWGRSFDEWRYDPRVRTGSARGIKSAGAILPPVRTICRITKMPGSHESRPKTPSPNTKASTAGRVRARHSGR